MGGKNQGGTETDRGASLDASTLSGAILSTKKKPVRFQPLSPLQSFPPETDEWKKRKELIDELIATETKYVSDLRKINNIFIRPMRNLELIKEDELNLGAISAITEFHNTFLPEI